MTKRNETRYDEAQDAMRDGADDEQIRREFGFNRQVIAGLRAALADKGPKTW
ncbi:MAG: hypothetical protein L0K70_05265 [Bifidobacterium crudilactis]|uniref:hypothetical protein n=1 Tax=Yaniella sp. TaxID=2773929 RepID=UPI0026473ECC|nr:hypothetical protein [Yaniella sp.]MDN6458066.1 hypothetical protein [Yaniella sp.]MDN6623092.1 hypothetical protein [Bifidobacterium crudilactis]MDN6655930.1 hypothetical protein [Bifidobacterium crudilactis]